MENVEDNIFLLILQLLFFILISVVFITLIWICFNKLHIRSIYTNTLPNHKDLLMFNQNITLYAQTASISESKSTQSSSKNTSKQESQARIRERCLPPSILPYDNKSIKSNKNEIIEKSKQLFQQLSQQTESSSNSITPSIIQPEPESDLIKKVKKQAAENEQKIKTREAEQKKKRMTERLAKKAELEAKAKEEEKKASQPATTSQLPGGFSFTFGQNK